MTKYIGIPYIEKGRTLKGCDCYGLVKLYYKNELGISIPDSNTCAKTPRRTLAVYLEQISKNWEETTAQKNAVVAMCLNVNHPKMVTHFGVMIDENTMLHTYENTNSHIISIDHITVKNQIKGFYKWHC
jgi:cell wall-associated NlpC family hydrolase